MECKSDKPFRLSMDYMFLPDKFKERIELLVDILKDFSEVEKIVLFGSCAEEQVKEGSDVDIALVGDYPHNTEIKALQKMKYEHSIWDKNINFEFDIYLVDKSDWINPDNQGNFSILRSIKKKGLKIYDKTGY